MLLLLRCAPCWGWARTHWSKTQLHIFELLNFMFILKLIYLYLNASIVAKLTHLFHPLGHSGQSLLVVAQSHVHIRKADNTSCFQMSSKNLFSLVFWLFFIVFTVFANLLEFMFLSCVQHFGTVLFSKCSKVPVQALMQLCGFFTLNVFYTFIQLSECVDCRSPWQPDDDNTIGHMYKNGILLLSEFVLTFCQNLKNNNGKSHFNAKILLLSILWELMQVFWISNPAENESSEGCRFEPNCSFLKALGTLDCIQMNACFASWISWGPNGFRDIMYMFLQTVWRCHQCTDVLAKQTGS